MEFLAYPFLILPEGCKGRAVLVPETFATTLARCIEVTIVFIFAESKAGNAHVGFQELCNIGVFSVEGSEPKQVFRRYEERKVKKKGDG